MKNSLEDVPTDHQKKESSLIKVSHTSMWLKNFLKDVPHHQKQESTL